jgi:hypothetical protein
MAKVPGFLRPREVNDEAELERVRIRTLERLAAIFGDAAASLQAPADLPAPMEQSPAVQAPREPDPAPTTGPRGASRPPTLAERPPDLVGVMAERERPDVEAPPEPNAATIVGVMAGHSPANKVGPTDDWRSRADAYVLAVAFGVARGPIPGRGADSTARVESRRADAIQPVPAAQSVDLRREGPRAVEHVNGPVLRKIRANRPRSASGPRS